MTVSTSRILLLAAALALVLSTTWSLKTRPDPGSDRYDYAGCAYNASRGLGLRPLVDYPLRFAMPGAQTLPAANLTRPPLWPALLVPLLRAGLGDAAGVLMAAVCAVALLYLVAFAAERTFGEGTGGVAALALASSFVVTRAIWGGGPELAMALVTYALWTWSPREQGRLAHLACGSLYGLLPLLHPFGWVLAALVLAARGGRYADKGRGWLLVGGLMVSLPWHARAWITAASPHFYVQSVAELAKEVLDPAGMGPYRGLTRMPSFELIARHPGAVLATWGGHLRHIATHLDQWLAWPLLVAAVIGARQAPRLAVRDGALLLLAILCAAFWSREFRLLVPLLPVVCTWVGAAAAGYVRRWRGPWLALTCVVLCVAPWVLPLGRALRPGAELAAPALDSDLRDARLLRALAAAGDATSPFWTDSAALAWQARRQAVLLPRTPGLLDTLRQRPQLRRARVIALTAGRASVWTSSAPGEWADLLAQVEVLDELRDGALVARLPVSQRAAEPGGAPTSASPPNADTAGTPP